MADCSKGGIRPPETHGHRQWTAVYVGSLAAWMTTTGYTAAVGISDELDVIGKISWRQTMQASVDDVSIN